jgi:hypothetical protein
MTRVILDRNTIAKLDNFERIVEVCDEDGRVLGYVSPIAASYSDVDVPLTDDEVAELRKQPRGRPLRDILAELERAK